MSVLRTNLEKRSNHSCELCGNIENLKIYKIEPVPKKITLNESIFACEYCINQMQNPEAIEVSHWRCLNDSMWSEHLPVQIASWRMLTRLKDEGWPQDLLDMMYLEEEALAWAKASGEGDDDTNKLMHRDSNGAIIEAGDSVVLIKDLPVKGFSMIAKRGTAVRRVSLDHENETFIEGKVDGQHIVLLTKYVKKI